MPKNAKAKKPTPKQGKGEQGDTSRTVEAKRPAFSQGSQVSATDRRSRVAWACGCGAESSPACSVHCSLTNNMRSNTGPSQVVLMSV
jgi:hypothetical protein